MDRTGQDARRPIAAGWARALFYLLQLTWGLSVDLAGLLLFLCCRGRFPQERSCSSIVTRLPGERGGLSLGIFLFLSARPQEDRALLAQEYGHTVQCLFLGPLYWPVVAIPSAVWCHLFAGWRRRHRVPYDALYCERWATAWGRRWSGL